MTSILRTQHGQQGRTADHHNLAQKIAELTAVRELTDVTRPEDYGLADPSFTVTAKDEDGNKTVYVEGTTREIVFYAYNVDSYLLKITDMHGMLVSAQDVDRLIRMLKQKG